jgi:hypothetical protein
VENKESKIRKSGMNLAFIRADMDFDFFKNIKSGFYDHALLFDGNTAIRTYNKNTGEERSVRYEVLNGLNRVLTVPEKIAYTPMDVRDSYVYHNDSGHGWLEVPAGEIKAMGLERRITRTVICIEVRRILRKIWMREHFWICVNCYQNLFLFRIITWMVCAASEIIRILDLKIS